MFLLTIQLVCHFDIESQVRSLLIISHADNVMLVPTLFNGTLLSVTSEWTMQCELGEQTYMSMKSIGETQPTRLRCSSDQIHQHAKVTINRTIHIQLAESQAMKDTCEHNVWSMD